MVYETFSHLSDAGVRGIGRSWSEAFVEGAKAMFSLQVTNLDNVQPVNAVNVKASAKDMAALFVEWLNELIFLRDTESLFFSDFEVKISGQEGDYQLTGKAKGEKLDLKRHQTNVDVKAATYSGLRCEQKAGEYLCQCVVDI